MKAKTKIALTKLTCLLLTSTLAFSITSCSTQKDHKAKEDTKETSVLGTTITLGNYGGENISWIILDEKDGKYLVLSEYAIDAKPYEEDGTNITWENCSLRAWLNEDFYNEAFSEEEQNRIINSDIPSDENHYFENEEGYSVTAGNSTNDNIFLLSITEVETYFGKESNRICYPTKSAIDNYCLESSYNHACWWWLRTPGYNQYNGTYVEDDGDIDYTGSQVICNYYGVRPAMWITQ